MKNNRLVFLDAVRSISILLIIFFHYNCATVRIVSEDITLFDFYKFAGNIGVSMFFILSGASLGISSKKDFSILNFYKKRFLAIFPLFWTVYILFFIAGVIFIKPSHFQGINPLMIVFTILGIDGFLLYKIPNFYLIGEWFLGCLLILYAFFPILRYLFFLNRFLLLLISFFLLFFLTKFYSLDMSLLRFPLFRLFELVFGMHFISIYNKDSLKGNSLLLFLSLIGIFAIFYFDFEKNMIVSNIVLGILSFVLLSATSSILITTFTQKFISFLSKYSFAAFLVHHLIIVKIVTLSKSLVILEAYNFFIFIFTILIIYFIAFLVQNSLNFALKKIKF